MEQTINPTSRFDIYTNYQIGGNINFISGIGNLNFIDEIAIKSANKTEKLLFVFEWAYRVCFLLAFVWLGYLALPTVKNKLQNFDMNIFKEGKVLSEVNEVVVDIVQTPDAVATPDPATLPFSIEIDKIGVNDKVIANVDAKNSTVYNEALEEGVAHGLNSGFPGEGEMIYIFGHSTDFEWNVETYNAIFYKIKDLEIGDEIILHHGDRDYYYEMYDRKILPADDTESINNMMDEDILILQTCYPPGTSWQRLIVIAKPIREEENGMSGFELVL